jgi:hypothetical protein
MNVDDRFARFIAVALLALSARCTRQGRPVGDEGASAGGARADAGGCLRYPHNVAPPVSGALAAGGAHVIPRVLIAASGRVALLDDSWRIMVWDPAAGREAVLLPGMSTIPVAGAGDVLFQRNAQGSISRLALVNGELDAPISDACGNAGVVSAIRGALDRPVVGLVPRASGGGGVVIQFGEGASPACTVAFRETRPGWTLVDAQASRDLLVVTESGAAGATRAVFHRRDGSADRTLPVDPANVELAADAVVFWSFEDTSVLVGSTRDPIPTLTRVALFDRLPLNQACVAVEATAGRFVLFRNDCVGPDGGPGASQRVLFDAAEKRPVAKLDGIAGPVGVRPDGKLLAAGPDGVCPVRARP